MAVKKTLDQRIKELQSQKDAREKKASAKADLEKARKAYKALTAKPKK